MPCLITPTMAVVDHRRTDPHRLPPGGGGVKCLFLPWGRVGRVVLWTTTRIHLLSSPGAGGAVGNLASIDARRGGGEPRQVVQGTVGVGGGPLTVPKSIALPSPVPIVHWGR